MSLLSAAMGRRGTSLALALGLLIAGCSGEEPNDAAPRAPSTGTAAPSSSPTPTTSAPVSSAATSTPAPPEMPPEARELTAAGAEAFVRYWFHLVNYGYASGDTSLLRSVSAESCQTCASTIETIENQYASGGSFRGGQISLPVVVASSPDASNASLVSISLDQEPLQRLNSGGDVMETSDGEADLSLGVLVEGASGTWRMAAIAPEETG